MDKKHCMTGLMLLLAAVSANADPVGLAKAKQLAAKFAKGDAEMTLVGSTSGGRPILKTNGSAQSTSPYYIFSRGEGQGFVIVSGDDCLPEILGYTESGDYDADNMPPAFKDWLDGYAELITAAQASGESVSRNASTASTASSALLLTATAKQDIPYMVQTHWHQESPYNNLCPDMTSGNGRAMTGCVATAAAQAVYYYHKDNPETLQATTPTYGYGAAPVTRSFEKGTPLKWDLMLTSYSGSIPAEYSEAVATLMASLGAGTWLTYGQSDTDRSTSGQIMNLVNTFSSYFNLSSQCVYKSGESQSAWETLIYNDLLAGHPIVYSGVHPSSGGHAVILDGYQASTNLFHFNFGWGGQADGWYTVDDNTGMNGFKDDQGMVYGITPKKANLSVSLEMDTLLALSRTNEVKVNVHNGGTLDYSGIYIFASSSEKAPTSLSSAKLKNTDVVASDEDMSISYTLKPSTQKTWYVYVTDKNLNVLASASADVKPADVNLVLEDISVKGSSASETIEGQEYAVVYNPSKVTVSATLSNKSGVGFSTNTYLTVCSSSDGGKTFEVLGTKSAMARIEAGATSTVEYTVSNSSTLPLETGKQYYAYITNPVVALNLSDEIHYATEDTLVRFVLREGDLAAEFSDSITLKFSGQWDVNKFNTIVETKANAAALRYDLTAVEGVGEVPDIDGKTNALVYVAEGSSATGKNVVKQGAAVSETLELAVGSDFAPLSSFTAKSFKMDINQEPNVWCLLTSPASVPVAKGMIAREITGHTSSGINNKTVNVKTLEAGKTYLLMSASSQFQTLSGENVAVAASTVGNLDADVTGSFMSTTLSDAAYVISPETNYFETVKAGEVVEALRGYIVKGSGGSSRFRANSSILLDNNYIKLGQAIDSCLDMLEAYKDVVPKEAYDNFSDSIDATVDFYSEQSGDNTSTSIKNRTSALLAVASEYVKGLSEGLDGIAIDFTGAIVNPSFEDGLDGWTTESKTVSKSVKASSSYLYKGVGMDGDYLLYDYASDSTSVAVSQVVTGLTPGIYTLTAMVGTDDGHQVTLYAGDKESVVDAHAFGRFYLTEGVVDSVEVGEDGTLEVGIKAGRWFKADDFRLTCLRTSGEPDAIEAVEQEPSISSVKVEMRGGALVLTAAKASKVTVYSLTGAAVWTGTVLGTKTIELPHGLYVVCGKKVML